jgi:hypothetical protein
VKVQLCFHGGSNSDCGLPRYDTVQFCRCSDCHVNLKYKLAMSRDSYRLSPLSLFRHLCGQQAGYAKQHGEPKGSDKIFVR